VPMRMTRLNRGSPIGAWTRLPSTTMNTLAQLVPLIYHERQEEGSMLCAQHALNSLLRTPADLPVFSLDIQLTIDLHRGTLGLSPFRSFPSEQHE
jgi:hypothetical protein